MSALRDAAERLARADADRAAIMRERDQLIRAAREEGRHWTEVQEAAGMSSPRAVALALKRAEKPAE